MSAFHNGHAPEEVRLINRSRLPACSYLGRMFIMFALWSHNATMMNISSSHLHTASPCELCAAEFRYSSGSLCARSLYARHNSICIALDLIRGTYKRCSQGSRMDGHRWYACMLLSTFRSAFTFGSISLLWDLRTQRTPMHSFKLVHCVPQWVFMSDWGITNAQCLTASDSLSHARLVNGHILLANACV